jgi:hypothetical protein
MTEDPLAHAERHVRESEQRIAKQMDRIARMKADGDSERAIAAGEGLLVTLQWSLDLMRKHLAWERSQSQRQ